MNVSIHLRMNTDKIQIQMFHKIYLHSPEIHNNIVFSCLQLHKSSRKIDYDAKKMVNILVYA